MNPTRNLLPLAATAALSLTLLAAAPGDAVTLDGAMAVPRTVAPPKIAYAFAAHPRFEQGDWRLLEPTGTSQKLSRATWTSFVVRGRTAIGSYATEGEPGFIVERVGAGGHVSRLHGGDGGYGLVTTADRTIVGWPSDDGGVLTLGTDGKQIQLPPVPIPKGTETPVVEAIEGSGTCKEDYPEGGGCSAFVGQPGLAQVWVTTSHGIVQRVPHIAEVKDVNRGRLIGPLPGMGEQECSGLLGPQGRRVWRTCDTDLQSFSPSGKYVVGTAPHYNAQGSPRRRDG